MTEIATATENYIKIPDSKNYVFAITVPFRVKVGNLVDVWFKAGTQIRWDLMNVLGAVSQLVLAGFNVINSHDLVLDIGAILSNSSQLLSDLQGDPAGFIVRLPGTLGLDGAPNFLRFKQGGADIWKQIPTNFSKAFSWSGQGLEYMFGNPCKDNDPALVCYKDGKLRFNLDLQKQNKFMGKEGEGITGELPLPGGFTSETAQNVVKILKNGGEKFDCSKDDNAIHISEGPDKFDVSKIVNTVSSFIEGSITQIPLPNFMKIDVCRFFGAEAGGPQPKPIRDLLFPHELVQDGNEYKTADAGKFFAVEVEASRNFYLKAITLGNDQDNPIYLSRWVNYGDLVIVTNLFTNPPHLFVPQLPYLEPAWVRFVSGLTTISYVKTTTTIPITREGSTIPIPVTFSYVIPTTNQFEGIKIERGFGDFKNFAPLLDPTKYNSGLPENTIGLLVSKNWVKGDYVARGDGKRFVKVKDQKVEPIEQDFLDPLISFISLRWHSQYPQDVVSSLTAILDDIGMKFLIYVLFKDPSWNSSTQIDICSVLYAFASSAKQKYDAATDSMKKSAIEDIVKAVYVLQKSRGDQQVWNCSVINIRENPFSFDAFQVQADWKGSTNQIANDLLGLGLFAIAALGVE
jgi:hypothetical protein